MTPKPNSPPILKPTSVHTREIGASREYSQSLVYYRVSGSVHSSPIYPEGKFWLGSFLFWQLLSATSNGLVSQAKVSAVATMNIQGVYLGLCWTMLIDGVGHIQSCIHPTNLSCFYLVVFSCYQITSSDSSRCSFLQILLIALIIKLSLLVTCGHALTCSSQVSSWLLSALI